MVMYNIHDAKSQLSKLIDAAQRGDQVIIAKAGKPVAILSPLPSNRSARVRGLLKGEGQLSPEFDDPLPADMIDAFEGKT